MKDLVVMKKDSAWTDSRVVSEYFTKGNHYKTKNIIEKLIKDHNCEGTLSVPLSDPDEPLIIRKKGNYRNQEFEYFLLNKTAFILLSMRYKTKEAVEWQRKFAIAFTKMERAISQQQNETWIESRKQGKQARRLETDIIKEYVEYATNQGSQNAKHYYTLLTKATYKALKLLEHNKPSTRDMLDVFQVNQLFMAEVVVTKSLRDYMAMGVHYKEIFKHVKADLEKYASLIDMTGIKQLKVAS